ncbi:MAG: HDOD domain-containing protein [Acidobacteria bacterium]|nr:MAG: HDOD domain-containing protein [Acidobacteriota bacterium]
MRAPRASALKGGAPGPMRAREARAVPTIAGVEIQDVGVLPQVAAKVNELASRPDVTGDQIASIILRDPTLTSKVLRLVNSAAFGPRQEIRSLKHAIAYLGINQIRNLVVSSVLVESFRFDHGIVEPRSVWEHCFGCALGAKQLGDLLPDLDGTECYLGGLLHDLGRIVFLSHFSEAYGEVVGLCERGLCPLRDAETSRFGISHAEAGYELGRSWNFSEPVLAMIRYHHEPDAAGPWAPLAAVVGLADAVCHVERLRFGFEIDDDDALEEFERAWSVLLADIPAADRRELAEPVEAAVRRARSLVAGLF